MRLPLWLASAVFAATLAPFATAQTSTCAGMTPGQLTSLNGFVPFPANNLWNTDISSMPVDPNSNNFINYIGGDQARPSRFRLGNIFRKHHRYSLPGRYRYAA